MYPIALDIETMPNPAMIDQLPEPEVALGNTKDPEKVAAKIAEAKVQQVADMALSPWTGMLASYSIVGHGDARYYGCMTGTTREEEYGLLAQIGGHIAHNSNGVQQLVTFNGIAFDLPFIYGRFLAHSLDIASEHVPPLSYWTRRYSTSPHADMMQILTNWSNKWRGLDYFGQLLLGERKIDFDVTKIPEMITTEEGRTKLVDYNERDALLTYRLYTMASGVLFPAARDAVSVSHKNDFQHFGVY